MAGGVGTWAHKIILEMARVSFFPIPENDEGVLEERSGLQTA